MYAVCFLVLVILYPYPTNTYFMNNSDTLVVELQDPKDFQQQIYDAFSRKNLKSLTINLRANHRWIVFGDLLGYQDIQDDPSYDFKYKVGSLPDELVGMDQLEVLNVSFLGLNSLPESITQLHALQELDISFNRLNISVEVEKLVGLNQLEVLKAYGCGLTEDITKRLQIINPKLRVRYTKQHFMEDSEVELKQ